MKILFLFGPNLGALGRREPEKYGTQTLAEIMAGISDPANGVAGDHEIVWRQSDHEGELVGWFQNAASEGFDGIVCNPGAFTHYSYALRDAIEGCGLPVIEVHQTNIYSREAFRQHSVMSPVCRVVIAGAGAGGYRLAVEALGWIE